MKTVNAGYRVKARLRNVGKGTFELVDNTIKFYTETGRFRKRRETAREIPLTDIDNVERAGNDFSITWKGTTDVFVIEEKEPFEPMYERITEALKGQKKSEEERKATTDQKRNELIRTLDATLNMADSLFDVLRSLHGQVDWNLVEGYSKRTEESFRNLTDQKTCTITLDFTKLLSAANNRRAEEISKETYSVLKVLHEYFSGLSSKNEPLEQTHPNYHDAKTILQAYYTLNDIILGVIVGDEEVGKESNELAAMLGDLSKATNLKIEVDAIRNITDKFGADKGKESIIDESRAIFRQQLKELITPASA